MPPRRPAKRNYRTIAVRKTGGFAGVAEASCLPFGGTLSPYFIGVPLMFMILLAPFRRALATLLKLLSPEPEPPEAAGEASLLPRLSTRIACDRDRRSSA